MNPPAGSQTTSPNSFSAFGNNMDDRSWMSKSRVSKEYQDGLKFFLDFAFANGSMNGMICCPCKRCGMGVCRNRAEAYEHLTVDGFIRGYTQWIAHGEIRTSPSSWFERQHRRPRDSTRMDVDKV